MIFIEDTISVPGRKEVPCGGLQILYDRRRFVSHIDPQFSMGPIVVRFGGENGTYVAQPNFRRWEMLGGFPCTRCNGDVAWYAVGRN